MRNTAGRKPASVGSALSEPRLCLGAVPSRSTLLTTLTSPAQPTETERELSVWESEGGRLASLTDAT
jgi:hypothetical protein